MRPVWVTIARMWYKDNAQLFDKQGPGFYEDYKGERDETPRSAYMSRRVRLRESAATGMTRYMKFKQRMTGRVYPMMYFYGPLSNSILSPGAEAVKLEGGAEIGAHVEAVVRAGVPVLGHIGLTPQDVLVLGGYKVQGRSDEAAQKLVDDACDLQGRGIFALVLECMPAALAARVTESVDVPTIGIGAGPACDGQILVFNDIVGMYEGRRARFVKVYADLGTAMREGVARYAAEVRSGSYPNSEHSYQ